MESPILKRIAEFLQEQKKYKQWRAVFIILAVFVGVGTVTALRMMGLAMTHKERVLHCQFQLHEHEKSCYDRDKNLICGYADYVVHKHNDDCYNADLKLVCSLQEIEKHEHTKECYNKTVTLVCRQEETAGHEHTDQCYTNQKGDLNCKKPEHSHSDACYDEESNLICGMEEHQHDDNCYKWEDVLTCKIREGEGGHTHSDECYVEQKGLTCGQLEMHTHTDKCFEKIDKNGKNEPGNLRLVCGKIQLEEHIHTEAAGCLETVEAAPGEISQEPEVSDEPDGSSEEGGEIFSTDLDGEETEGEDVNATEGEAPEGEDSEAAEGEEGSEIGEEGSATGEEGSENGEEAEDGTEEETEEDEAVDPETYEESKTYEGLGYIVTASYNKDANIPEEARLIAEQITEESDSENYKKHEAQFKENVKDAEATMSALFKIGFYVEGEEVEPETSVLVTIQFVDKNGLPEGTPIKVVHFGDEGTEVIDGGKAESGSTSFKTNGFSVFGVGFNKEADAEEASVHIAESYEYEDAAFHITFHVEGEAKLFDGNEKNSELDKKDEEISDTEEKNDNTENVNVPDETVEETEDSEAVKGKLEAEENVTKEQKFEFKVDELDENSKEYKEVLERAKSENNGSELLLIRPLTYSMYLDGEKLDISGCKVTAKVETADALNKCVNNSVPEALSYIRKEADIDSSESAIKDEAQTEFTVSVLGINTNENTVCEFASMVVDENNTNGGIDVLASEEGNDSDVIAPYISTQANPNFTVQYYANLNRVKQGVSESDTIKKTLDVINTDGKGLPQNGVTPDITKIGLDVNGNVYTEKKLTEVYKERNFSYIKAPTLKYFNALVDNTGYVLKEIWVYKAHVHDKDNCYTEKSPGEFELTCKEVDAASINKNDWEVHTYLICDKNHTHNESCYNPNLHFTNREITPEGDEKFIMISQDATIRLVYDVVEKNEEFNSTFYDYDISDGNVRTSDSVKIINTGAQGINSSANCAEDVKYAFGNNNAGTNYGEKSWNGNKLNKSNPNGYAGCTFGLVSSANGEKVNFNVPAPEIFGSTERTGKTIYGMNADGSSDYKLAFNRAGDTYTLTAVTGANTQNLHFFTNTKGNIWSNNFWPMDAAPSWGTAGHDIRFGNSANKKNLRFEPGDNEWKALPVSDDGMDHNSYFGMYYEVPFEIPEDYTGPLEYLFFGDDDMWVFLDDETLVCDIGGVHSSVGEYVNLWDYLENADGSVQAGPHTLKFFYTERGASGSSCWMHFTLPSVTSATPQTSSKDYGQLRIEKTVSCNRPDLTEEKELQEMLNRDTFTFQLKFKGARDDYSYTKYEYDENAEGGVRKVEDNLIIHDGGKFTLKNNQYIVINYLPSNAEYEITENDVAVIITESESGEIIGTSSDKEYFTDIEAENVSIGEDGKEIHIDNTKQTLTNLYNNKVIDGTVPANGISKVHYTNKFDLYELPETGGSGIIIYTIAGVLCILLGAGIMYTKKG
ncbi:fibro-slime domain-containing protein [Lachnospiraceae bacterium MD308]|nr:fibro-slime domain-containing protein [Lachnospiraceae bacterium MD308]